MPKVAKIWKSVYLRMSVVLLCCVTPVLSSQSNSSRSTIASPSQREDSEAGRPSKRVSDERTAISESSIAAAQATAVGLSQQISTSEWLGPLSAVALSPFFGMTCLSGMAIWGADYLPNNNALLQAATPLKNPTVFWAFLILTIITSLPRFSKVSKPIAQAADFLETWSTIICVLVVRWSVSVGAGESEGSDAEVLTAGIGSVSFDLLLSAAMVINIFVINSVKFFFELLIWISPIPLLDAAFEILNKAIVAGLMAVYAFSPWLATALNLILLAICLVVFRWCWRQIQYFRTLLLDPLWRKLFGRNLSRTPSRLVLFPKRKCLGFPPRSRLVLNREGDSWYVRPSGWWGLGKPKSLPSELADGKWSLRRGWLSAELLHSHSADYHFVFSRHSDEELQVIAAWVQAEYSPSALSISNDPLDLKKRISDLRGELI